MENLNYLLTTKNEELREKQEQLENFEIDPDDYEDQYCDFLDEFETVKIGNLEYSPSLVLKEVDPTAYRCGLLDYVDSIDKTDSEEYKELEDEIAELESEIEDLENEIAEVENEEI